MWNSKWQVQETGVQCKSLQRERHSIKMSKSGPHTRTWQRIQLLGKTGSGPLHRKWAAMAHQASVFKQNCLPGETSEWKSCEKEDIQVPVNWGDKKLRSLGLSWIGREGISEATEQEMRHRNGLKIGVLCFQNSQGFIAQTTQKTKSIVLMMLCLQVSCLFTN